MDKVSKYIVKIKQRIMDKVSKYIVKIKQRIMDKISEFIKQRIMEKSPNILKLNKELWIKSPNIVIIGGTTINPIVIKIIHTWTIAIMFKVAFATASEEIRTIDYSQFTDLNVLNGNIHKAFWEDFGETVVLKRRRKVCYEQELRKIQKISFHPNIVRFYGLAEGE
ncbi:19774_t:CDS:2 [Gigaspora rosea]|nr:19774_t:CDS:2 [Gigaspora rosea]